MSDWQIWFMKPDWLECGRFYKEAPNPANLTLTHIRVGSCPDGAPEAHVGREYKEYIFNKFAQRHPKPGPDDLRQMAWGDVMVSPKGDVWTVEFWGFQFVGPGPAPRHQEPMWTIEDVRWVQRPGGPGLPVIRLHHRAPGAPRPIATLP